MLWSQSSLPTQTTDCRCFPGRSSAVGGAAAGAGGRRTERPAPPRAGAAPDRGLLRSPGWSRPWELPPLGRRRWLMETKRNKLSATPGARLSPFPEARFSTWTGSPGMASYREAMRPLRSVRGLSGGPPARPMRQTRSPARTEPRRSARVDPRCPPALSPAPRSLSSPSSSSSSSRCCPSRCRPSPCASTGTTVKLVGMVQAAPGPLAPPSSAGSGQGEPGAAASLTWEPFPHAAGGAGARHLPSPLRRGSHGAGPRLRARARPWGSPSPSDLALQLSSQRSDHQAAAPLIHTETAFQRESEPGCRTLVVQITVGMTASGRPKQEIYDHILDKWRKSTGCLWTTRT